MTINESKKYLEQSETESKPIHKKNLDLSKEEKQAIHERNVKKIEDFKAELAKNTPKLLFTLKGFNQAKEGHAPFMGKNKQKAQIAELNSL